MLVQAYIEAACQRLERQLDVLVGLGDLPYNQLFEGARYSLLGPGKRLRPLLVFAVVELLEGEGSAALIPACAIELIHTYSLIHDDLPCMDDSDLRRGRPTLHKVVPEGQAVLVGDYLLTYAFELLTGAPHLSAEQRLLLCETLAKRAGGHGMIGGQVMDLSYVDELVDLETLQMLHLKKTAALITAALEFGGIISRADADVMSGLQLLGQTVGLAFQIVDDILDATSHQGQLGKPTGKDAGRASYVSAVGLDQARVAVRRLQLQTQESVNSLPGDTRILGAIVEKLTHRST